MRYLALLTILLMGGLLFYGTPDFPSWGDPQSPASLHVSPYYIEHAVEDTAEVPVRGVQQAHGGRICPLCATRQHTVAALILAGR